MSIKKKSVFAGVVENDGDHFPIPNHRPAKKLAPGVYTAEITHEGKFFFKTMSVSCDNIIDLPSAEYQQVMYDINTFLKADTKVSFDKYGFVYKRSALLYGIPGSGKTMIVNRIISNVINGGGVVIFNPDPRLLQTAFSVLEDVQPEVLTLVVFEEFDSTVEDHESELLSILDGEIQKSNIMYLATTNYKDKIPARILRPGRFSSLIEVKRATLEARQAYLEHKGLSKEEAAEWAAKTNDYTIDELKEVVLSVKCLNYPIDMVLQRINEYKKEKPVDEKAIKQSAEFDLVEELNSMFTQSTRLGNRFR